MGWIRYCIHIASEMTTDVILDWSLRFHDTVIPTCRVLFTVDSLRNRLHANISQWGHEILDYIMCSLPNELPKRSNINLKCESLYEFHPTFSFFFFRFHTIKVRWARISQFRYFHIQFSRSMIPGHQSHGSPVCYWSLYKEQHLTF